MRALAHTTRATRLQRASARVPVCAVCGTERNGREKRACARRVHHPSALLWLVGGGGKYVAVL